MKISVIVPVYNTQKYLNESIGSLLAQTIDELEIIAVDDGSTDCCGKMLDDFQKNWPDRIKVFHKENGGQATARNLAILHCTGEYIGFLDSDDAVEPEMFQKMYEKAKESDADYAACGYRDTALLNGVRTTLKEYVSSKPAAQTTDLFFGALASPLIHIYKRSIIINHGIRFPEGFIYEDTAFYLNAIPYIQKIALVEEPLAIRTRRPQSTMTICKKEKVAQIMPVLENSITFYRDHNFYHLYQQELEYFCVRVLLCSSMERIAKVPALKDRRELVLQTLNFIQKYFPDYRKNTYFKHGLLHQYIKSFCRITAEIYLPILRLKVKTERQYL